MCHHNHHLFLIEPTTTKHIPTIDVVIHVFIVFSLSSMQSTHIMGRMKIVVAEKSNTGRGSGLACKRVRERENSIIRNKYVTRFNYIVSCAFSFTFYVSG